MTPLELLESVKARFIVLLHDEEERLVALLRQALGEYQDRAGAVIKIRLASADAAPLPSDFLATLEATDSTGTWHEVVETEDGLQVAADAYSQPPFSLAYLANLRSCDLAGYQLPAECIGLVQKYLYALIEEPNTERLRQVSQGAGLPVDQLPGASELSERLRAIEQEMTERAGLLNASLVL